MRPLHSLQRTLAWACALWLCTAVVQAQTVYRIVGSDGRITFSDQPPHNGAPAKAAPKAAASPAAVPLPFVLQQAAARYPVTLYTSPDCVPCNAGRAMLGRRGIPFAERSVTSGEDVAALKRLAGVSTLPLLTLGAQQLQGYSEVEWNLYLDAAGYPKTSALPPGYRPAPSQPLVTLEPPAAGKADSRPDNRPEPNPAPAVTPANPAGIRF